MNKLSTLTFVALLLGGCGGSSSPTPTPAPTPTPSEMAYSFEFKSTWSATDFPTNYPSNAHFSPLVGMLHNDQIHLYESSMLATGGVIKVAETGKLDIIGPEIDAFIAEGSALSKIEGSGIAVGENFTTVEFTANQSHSLLSMISMVAPSPDWFVGIDSVQLFENNAWKNNLEFQLKVYDSGSDDGTSFISSNVASDPRQLILLLDSDSADSDFLQGVHRDSGKTIATFMIKQK